MNKPIKGPAPSDKKPTKICCRLLAEGSLFKGT